MRGVTFQGRLGFPGVWTKSSWVSRSVGNMPWRKIKPRAVLQPAEEKTLGECGVFYYVKGCCRKNKGIICFVSGDHK